MKNAIRAFDTALLATESDFGASRAASPLKCNITSPGALLSTGINPRKISAEAC
jgi:hypothetical protein